MRRSLFWIALSIAAGIAAQPAAGQTCPRQPLPPAIDSAGPLLFSDPVGSIIDFAAKPSLESSGYAWVARLYRRGSKDTSTIEVVQLRQQRDCNRYDIESRWQRSVPAAEYADVAATLSGHLTPRPEAFATGQWAANDLVYLDGTSLSLRVRNYSWKTARELHLKEVGGRAISSVFRKIVAKTVPGDRLPSPDWRPR